MFLRDLLINLVKPSGGYTPNLNNRVMVQLPGGGPLWQIDRITFGNGPEVIIVAKHNPDV